MNKFTKEEFYKMFEAYGITIDELEMSLNGLIEKNLIKLEGKYYTLTEVGKFYAEVLFPKKDDNQQNPTTH